MTEDIMQQTPDTILRGKTVVITGASSGVGRATALAFALEQARLVLAARGGQALEEVAEACRRLGASAVAVPTDTSVAADVAELARQALAGSGRIDYWINNAGVLALGRFEEMPVAVTDQIVGTNLLGYMHAAHAVLPIFKRQGRGVLINNISIGGWMPAPYGTAYTASKFGVRGLVEGLQAEVSDWPDIHICALYPGFQRSTGIEHAANYSGLPLATPPPAFDPHRLAAAMVKVAKNPVPVTYPDWSAWVFKHLYGLFPGLVRDVSSAGLRRLMDRGGSVAPTAGNVLEPSQGPMQVHGRSLVPSRSVQKGLGYAALGLAAVLVLRRAFRN